MNDWRITLGIQKPEKEPTSINEMRVAIERAGRDSSLIRRSFDIARYAGMSGEDTYAHLAYYALRMLEQQYQINMQFLAATPSPLRYVKPAEETRAASDRICTCEQPCKCRDRLDEINQKLSEPRLV